MIQTKNTPLGADGFAVAPHIIKTGALACQHPLKIKRKDYPEAAIFTLRNVLTPTESNAIIAAAEQIGFQQAGLATGQDVYRVKEKARNNLRVMFEDTEMAEELWTRVAPHVDRKFQNHLAHGLNWRFRVYKYPPGGTFTPHVDDRMKLPGDGLITLFTFMIYLNENLDGGETTFFERRQGSRKKPGTTRVITPRTGMALVFDHLLFHEGSVVRRGVKYALRSDVIYRRK